MKVNVVMDISNDMFKKWKAGEVVISAVARSKKSGKIVQYMKLGAANTIAGAKSLARKVGTKNLLIGLGITAAAVTVGGIINLVVNKSSEKESVKVPKCINDFQKSFHKYLKETQKGTINVKTIDSLLSSLEEIENLDNKEVRIDFSADELRLILSKICDFTKNMNKEYSDEKVKLKSPTKNSNKNLVYLKDYLEYQKQVVEKIA